ncbi:MAG: BMP family ABC transporter substrate-binding protein [Acidimicrobiia bacterium]|nr:BMP family ABC transporter substrate-binding protein [Acidimicrobiia bacterium]
MRLTKRFVLLFAVLALVAAGCGDSDSETTVTTAETTTTTAAATTTTAGGDTTTTVEPMDVTPVKTCLVTDLAGIDDKSFNATAWQGVLDAIDAGYATAEPDSFFLESDTDADWQPNIDQMISQGCEHMVTVGFALDAVTQENAPTNPDINWTIVDVDFFDFSTDPITDVTFDNAIELTYQTDEAAFLAGYVAASVSESKVVGTFGGANFPTVSIFMDGFFYGVQHWNDVKGDNVRVLGWDPANPDTGLFTGDFTNLDIARATAQSLLDEGADVIMPVGGQINLGAGAAMQDIGMGADGDIFGALIGVDTDQFISAPEYADLWLTSVEKKMALGVSDSIRQTAEGTFTPGNTRGFLSNAGVGISPFHNFDSIVSSETKAEVEALQAAIIAGTQSVSGG